MEGIVIWTDRVSGFAIVWCEDGGRLATLSGWAAKRFRTRFPDVGDLLLVDVAEDGELRKVTRAVLKVPCHDPDIQARIIAAAADGLLHSHLAGTLRRTL